MKLVWNIGSDVSMSWNSFHEFKTFNVIFCSFQRSLSVNELIKIKGCKKNIFIALPSAVHKIYENVLCVFSSYSVYFYMQYNTQDWLIECETSMIRKCYFNRSMCNNIWRFFWGETSHETQIVFNKSEHILTWNW